MEAKIIGRPGCGKTTLLDALSEGRAHSGVAAVKVVDRRVLALSEIFRPRKTTFAEVRCREAEWTPGEGRRGQMARYIDGLTGAEVFLHVVRAFDNPMLGAETTPAADLSLLDQELVLADLTAIERVFERARKQPLGEIVKKTLERCQALLEDEIPLRNADLDEAALEQLRGYAFRTLVPQVVLVNTSADGDADVAEIETLADGRQVVAFPVSEAREVAELSAEEQLEFAQAMGLPGTAAEVVTQAIFRQMGLVSFFTVGEDEVRAWPIKKGSVARRAAGVIHSDLERGFIRAETVSYDAFLEHGTLKACRDAGVLRLEGKDYVVEDGDIINVRFNV